MGSQRVGHDCVTNTTTQGTDYAQLKKEGLSYKESGPVISVKQYLAQSAGNQF